MGCQNDRTQNKRPRGCGMGHGRSRSTSPVHELWSLLGNLCRLAHQQSPGVKNSHASEEGPPLEVTRDVQEHVVDKSTRLHRGVDENGSSEVRALSTEITPEAQCSVPATIQLPIVLVEYRCAAQAVRDELHRQRSTLYGSSWIDAWKGNGQAEVKFLPHRTAGKVRILHGLREDDGDKGSTTALWTIHAAI